ncbi:MAG: DUF1320 domain-containing protein [Burkholderiales bacterium]|nr:DUF1320 domain-containing protein [Burkholderiales bacterium]
MYATATDILDRFDAEEIAQRADRATPRLVTADLLKLAAAAGDLSGYTVAEQAAAAAALVLVNRALTDASDAIDGYLSGRYAVPLATPPQAIGRIACDLARYYLFDDQATDTVQKRYDTAVQFCRDVAAGKVSLGAIVDAPPSGGTVEMVSDGTVFGRANSGSFI